MAGTNYDPQGAMEVLPRVIEDGFVLVDEDFKKKYETSRADSATFGSPRINELTESGIDLDQVAEKATRELIGDPSDSKEEATLHSAILVARVLAETLC